MKKIVVGSLNKTKVNAIKSVFSADEIHSIDVPSSVLEQPITSEMTRRGAVHRANNGLHVATVDYSIGLEGGVTFIAGELYVCNWGALATSSGEVFTASGGLIPLPSVFIEPILRGEELATLMDQYMNKRDIRSQEGAIGAFTNGLITREQVYTYIGTLLKGQLLHDDK